MKNVTVAGSISTDFVVETSRRPNIGETVEGKSFSTSFGGKGANQAVASARLGANTSMIGAVGEDHFGDQLLQNLENQSISVSNVERVTHPSGTAFITLEDGDNSIIYVPGANAAYGPDKIKQFETENSVINESDIVLFQNEIPRDTVEQLIDSCFEKNVPILFNPAPAREINTEAIDKATFITPNETEFNIMFPKESKEEVLKRYPNKLIVTLGDKGAEYFDGETIIRVPAVKVDKVVDTTGAGDTFNGAFAFAYTSGLEIGDSIRFANIAAALSIQKEGAQNGAPTLEEMKGHEDYEETWHIK